MVDGQQTVLITGANRGIGLELARRYLQRGDRVVATARHPDQAQELAALVATAGEGVQSRLQIHALDVTSEESVAALAASVSADAIDILINNAGVMTERQSRIDMDYSGWLAAFDVHAIAPFRLTNIFLPQLQLAERGRAIVISSQMGALSRTSTGSFAYRSSKAAANKVAQLLALELADSGVIVCPVHPGWVRTDMGGPHADISVEDSCAGLVRLFDGLSAEQSGRFWNWDGTEHAW